MQDGKKEIDTSTATKRNCRIRRKLIQTYHNYVAKIVYSILSFYSTEIDIQAVINQVCFLLWEKAEQIDTNKCEDIKYYLAAIAKHEVINERNKFVRMLNWMKM